MSPLGWIPENTLATGQDYVCATGGTGPNSLGPVTWEVSTPVFEGPFDLLLHLILREQVDLYEVSLSGIVGAYLAELERLEAHLDLETATQFLLIAATLVELKARRLLPGPDDVEMDDDLAIWAERDVLLARLLECKTFADAGAVLGRMVEEASRSVPRTAGPDERFASLAPDPLEGVTAGDLRAAFLRAVAPKPVPRVDLTHVTAIRANVPQAVVELLDELPRLGHTTFRRLAAELSTMEVVVRFLALLELFKDGRVDLVQPAARGEITVRWLGARTEAHAPDLVDTYS
ncbi:segregation/condensation protein A [soil metagenome]